MMSEIYRRGPVVCSVATPEAFDYGYRSGIYKDPKNYTRDAIDHNVEVCLLWATDFAAHKTSVIQESGHIVIKELCHELNNFSNSVLL